MSIQKWVPLLESGRRGGYPFPGRLPVPSYIGMHRAIDRKGGFMNKRKLKREMKSLRRLLRLRFENIKYLSREIDDLEAEVIGVKVRAFDLLAGK